MISYGFSLLVSFLSSIWQYSVRFWLRLRFLLLGFSTSWAGLKTRTIENDRGYDKMSMYKHRGEQTVGELRRSPIRNTDLFDEAMSRQDFIKRSAAHSILRLPNISKRKQFNKIALVLYYLREYQMTEAVPVQSVVELELLPCDLSISPPTADAVCWFQQEDPDQTLYIEEHGGKGFSRVKVVEAGSRFRKEAIARKFRRIRDENG